jgi:hypothetical protein
MERLVNEEVTSFCVGVVRDQQTLRNFACSLFAVGRRSVEIFENLNTFTSGSGAHIESGVTWLDVE